MKNKSTRALLFLTILLMGAAGTALAKDAIKESVVNVTGSPIMTVNGNPYSQGTYAVGTIQLFYTVQGYYFTAGYFGSFDVDWTDLGGYSSGPATNYGPGVYFNLVQNQANPNLGLAVSPGSFLVTAAGQSSSSHVTMSIADSVPGDPSLNCDGCELTAVLQSGTDPSGAHLDTVTTILVHIKLVWPTACLKLYDFITDEAFTTTITSTEVNTRWDKKLGAYVVNGTNPYGQWSENVLLVNSCPDPKSFDLKVALDPHFDTNPSGNPGNATFTYSAGGAIDPSTFDISGFPNGAPQGGALCIPNLSVAAGDTFLATVHIGMNKGIQWSGGSSGTFNFSGEIDLPNSVSLSNCSGGTPLPEVAAPNPDAATVSYTQKLN
jgi:hypothetical protein